jgi:hypothetical protein
VNQVMSDCQCCDRHEKNHPTNTDMMNGCFSSHDYHKDVCERPCECPCRHISRCSFRQFWVNKKGYFPEETISMDSDFINLPTVSEVEKWLQIDIDIDFDDSWESKEIRELQRDVELVEEEIHGLWNDYYDYGDRQDMKDAHNLGHELKKTKETIKSLIFMEGKNRLPDVCEDVLEDMSYIR